MYGQQCRSIESCNLDSRSTSSHGYLQHRFRPPGESQYESDVLGGSAGVSSIFRAHFLPPLCVYLTIAGVPELIEAGLTGLPDDRIAVLSSKASITTSSLSFTSVRVCAPGSKVWICPSRTFVSSTRLGGGWGCRPRRRVPPSRSRYTNTLDSKNANRITLRIRTNLFTT